MTSSARTKGVTRARQQRASSKVGVQDATASALSTLNVLVRPSPSSPPQSRDCLDCRAKDGMHLQNINRTVRGNIPLLYVCTICGTLLTIPPPPLEFPEPKDG